jgi:virginiamycin B lyase
MSRLKARTATSAVRATLLVSAAFATVLCLLALGATAASAAVPTPSGTTKGPDRSFTTFTTAPLFEPCPNDSFRAGHPSANLPDCRAYEQASPKDKNGLDVSGTYPTVKASPNGDRVSFAAANGIPGAEGAQDFPLYLSTRDGAGWSTQGLFPPESTGESAKVIGWLPDFSQVFDSAIKFTAPPTATIVARSSTDGSLATIVPHEAFFAHLGIAGASADGSVVYFELEGDELTPGAAPGKDNLYAWDRATNEISLVGILPDGTTPPDGSFAGSYDWGLGTTPLTLARGGADSGYYTQAQHAISDDASKVYFTVGESGQLYLRRNPTKAQSPLDGSGKCTDPTLACTVHVSASHKTDGKGEDGRDLAGAQPAAFMAATPDGSKAFFTSSEKLTNDATTGPEPSPPAIAWANVTDGGAKNLSFLPVKASGVAVDGSHIYWADSKEGTIGRANLDGSSPQPKFIELPELEVEPGVLAPPNPQGVAVDATHIYWTNAAAEGEDEGTIGRASLAGTEVDQGFIEGASNPKGIDVDASHVYWVNGGTGNLFLNGFGYVGRADINGSNPNQEFANSASGDVAVNGSKIYFSRTNQLDGFIRSVNLDGSENNNVITMSGVSSAPEGLALDATHLYWTNPGKNTIGRSNLNGSGIEQSFIPDAGQPQGLAVDAAHLYWSAAQETLPNPGNDLYRFDAETGVLDDLTKEDTADENGAEVKGVLGTSTDGSYVYFAANGVLTSTPNSEGESAAPGSCFGRLDATSGTCNLYLWHGGAFSFIARLSNGGETNTDAANWTPAPRVGYPTDNRFQRTARVSPNGRTLLFRSYRKLGPYDNKGKPELYLYRAEDASLRCISCNPVTALEPALPTVLSTPVVKVISPASTLTRSLSEDGNRVFFESTDALVPADINGMGGCPTVGSELQRYSACQDVYEWEAKDEGTCESEAQNGGCLYLLSSGQSPEPSFFVDASIDGAHAFIITRSGLVGQDRDQLYDVYDASAGGGLASQSEVEPVPCEGEACKAGASTPSAFESPGSASFLGPGNPKGQSQPRCPKTKRRVSSKGKTRCVAKHRKRHRHRAVNATRKGN